MTRRLKVLHFADKINRYDFIDNVVRNLDPERFEASVATLSPESNIQDPRYDEVGIEHHQLNCNSRSAYPLATLKLAKLLRDNSIDIIHAHHFDPAAIALLATYINPKCCLIVGRHYSDEIYLLTDGLRRKLYLDIEKLVTSGSLATVVPSNQIKDLLVEKQSVASTKIVYIPYPFDSEKYHSKPPRAIKALRDSLLRGASERTNILIGCFSRLHWEKGHKFLLEGLSQLRHLFPDFICIIGGDGPEADSLRKQVCELGLENHVTFLGWRTDVADLIACCDIVVSPTLHEAFSQVMVEAMWIGKPLVISKVSGSLDIIDDHENGILVNPRQPKELLDALFELCSDSKLRISIGSNAKKSVIQNLSIEAIVPQFEKLYFNTARSSSNDKISLHQAAIISHSIAPITLVTPLKNEEGSLAELIESIALQSCLPAEIIFVDGGSSDRTTEKIVEVCERVSRTTRFLSSPELQTQFEKLSKSQASHHLGNDSQKTDYDMPVLTTQLGPIPVTIYTKFNNSPGVGRNFGIEHSNFPWVAMIDGGCSADSKWLEALEESSKMNPQASVIFGSYEPKSKGLPDYYWPAIVPPRTQSQYGQVRGPTSASMMIRKDLWERTGGFPNLRAAEDLLYFEQLLKTPEKCAWAPEATVYWSLPANYYRLYRRTRNYSKVNVQAHLQSRWHYGLTKQYLGLFAISLLAKKSKRRVSRVIFAFYLARTARVLLRHRNDMSLRKLFNPIRVIATTLALITSDAGTYLGWIDALRSKQN